MPRIVSIEEFYPTSPLSFSESLSSPQMTFDCQPPFLCLSTFLLSAFFSLSLSPSIPALIFLLVCWQRPAWPNCGFWRAPCVWSRRGRCQGGHVRSSLALCGAGCGAGGGAGDRAWMDGWMDGWAWAVGMHSDLCLLMLCSFFFLCSSSACVDLN